MDNFFNPVKQHSIFKVLMKTISIVIAVVIICLVLIYKFAFSTPSDFPTNASIIIEPGQSLTSIVTELDSMHVVRSGIVLRSAIILLGGERKVTAGLYEFPKAQNVLSIAKRIVRGEYGYTPVKMTIPEGTNVFKIASVVHEKFPHIDEQEFLTLIKPKEGYLFPNTYFFPPKATPDMIISMMSNEFEKELKPLATDIVVSGHSLQEVITMASILEGEVQTKEDRKMVADILWRRIQNGMPLQVDSTFAYINGKTSAELTLKDLKVDSPYNTYVYKGLPPGPISNPGLESIEAAIHPTPNNYLYFLSDKDGITHFARTHEEHVKNKEKHLK